MKKRIALLFHEHLARSQLSQYAIYRYAKIWSDDGHRVTAIYGPRAFKEADVAILHVDLSVVPEPYLALADRYPVTLNRRITDIRKNALSQNQVTEHDTYDGPVIVKSVLNHAGLPEDTARVWNGQQESRTFQSPEQYALFASKQDVPEHFWQHSGVLCEKFLAEREGDLYAVRFYNFIGDKGTCFRLLGPHPIVNGRSKVRSEIVEPHPDVLALRRQLGFDYGKFDYVERDGKAVVFDWNKTVGSANLNQNEELERLRRDRASGLYDYF